MQISLRNLNQTLGLTQVGRFPSVERLSIGENQSPTIFTRTLMASQTGEVLYAVGAGKVDPKLQTAVLLQLAKDSNKPFFEVADDLYVALTRLGRNSRIFFDVVSGVFGSNEKPLRNNAIPCVPPSRIRELIDRHLSGSEEVVRHIVTDFVCHMLAPLGAIMRDAAYVYRARQDHIFPVYSDLVDIVQASDVMRTLQILADADLSLVKSAMERTGQVSPAMISQALTNAALTAREISLGMMDPEAVVRSALTAIQRVGRLDLPEALQPRSRVRNHPLMPELRSNLALFLCYQDMVGKGMEDQQYFSDEELASVVLPMFHGAISELSPYKVRVLDDTIGHIGSMMTVDHMRQPGNIVLFEEWTFGSDVHAFAAIRHSEASQGRYLLDKPFVSQALSGAMSPIRAALDMRQLVERRIASYELVTASARMPSGGTQLSLAFPSLLDFELRHNLPIGYLTEVLRCNGKPTVPDGVEGSEGLEAITDDICRRVAFDWYSLLVHLACARAERVATCYHSSGATADDIPTLPFLVWQQSTSLQQPLADAPIVSGQMLTSEPVELLCYVREITPTSRREARVLNLNEHAEGVHLWRWYDASLDIDFTASYPVTVRNHNYVAAISSYEMLGLGVRHERLRFMRPTLAAAMARLWFNWVLDDDARLQTESAATSDTALQSALEGYRMQQAIEVVNVLRSLGSSGAGSMAVKRVQDQLAEQMRGRRCIDDFSEIHVGIQSNRLRSWAGLVTLQLLGLIGPNDAQKVVNYVASSRALTLLISSTMK